MQGIQLIRRAMLGGGALAYWQRQQARFGSSLKTIYRMTDLVGSTPMLDSVSGYHGAYNGPTLQAIQSPIAGELSPSFDGTGDDCNVYAAASAINYAVAGGIVGWGITDAWLDGSARDILSLYALTGDNFILKKAAPNNQIWAMTRYGGVDLVMQIVFSSLRWFSWCLTWSKALNKAVFMIDGYLPFPEQTGLGTWSGELYTDYSRLGGFGGGTEPFKGGMCNVGFIDRLVTQDEFLGFTEDANYLKKLTIIGDSIESAWNTWAYTVAGSKGYILKNHATGGYGIVNGGMALEVTAAAGDDSNYAIIALGANDDNAGDMATLQATYEAQVARFKAANSQAAVYALNVLPSWENNTTGAAIDKSNIRTAVAAACTAKGVTCWNPAGSITQAQTSDGTHLTDAGNAALTTWILARLP